MTQALPPDILNEPDIGIKKQHIADAAALALAFYISDKTKNTLPAQQHQVTEVMAEMTAAYIACRFGETDSGELRDRYTHLMLSSSLEVKLTQRVALLSSLARQMEVLVERSIGTVFSREVALPVSAWADKNPAARKPKDVMRRLPRWILEGHDIGIKREQVKRLFTALLDSPAIKNRFEDDAAALPVINTLATHYFEFRFDTIRTLPKTNDLEDERDLALKTLRHYYDRELSIYGSSPGRAYIRTAEEAVEKAIDEIFWGQGRAKRLSSGPAY